MNFSRRRREFSDDVFQLYTELGCNLVSLRSYAGILVIIPMVLQIRETMVLQGVELEGKGSTPHFCVFVSPAASMGKHGFAEKLHCK